MKLHPGVRTLPERRRSRGCKWRPYRALARPPSHRSNAQKSSTLIFWWDDVSHVNSSIHPSTFHPRSQLWSSVGTSGYRRWMDGWVLCLLLLLLRRFALHSTKFCRVNIDDWRLRQARISETQLLVLTRWAQIHFDGSVVHTSTWNQSLSPVLWLPI